VEPDLNLTNEILVFLLNKYETTDTNLSFFNSLNQDIEEGLNHGKSLKKNFEECDKKEFEFEIPVLINTEKLEERIKNDFNLPQKDIFFNRHNIQEQKSVEDFLKTIKDKSSSFEDFILRVEEHWNCNIFSSPTYQNNRKQYKEFYYSTLNKSDISRIIYRLMCIAFVGDYTIDYNKNIFKCTILKTSKEEYIKNTSLFINKYISNEKAKEIITKLRIDSKKNDDFNTILKCIRTILEFTYNEVVAKRKRAAEDMYTFIIDSIERGNAIKQKSLFKNYWYNHYLKEDLYYYFNAKYARKGFKIDGMDYSLTDDSDEGRLSEWKTFIKYGSILNKQSSFISECKMMRGSCRRIRRTLSQTDLNDEWVLKLLYSFATYGLNNAYYLEEASQNFLDGFRILYVKKSGANNEYDIFKKYIIEFENLLIESVNIPEIIEYFYLAKHSIMIEVNLSFTSKMINNHNEIKILHS